MKTLRIALLIGCTFYTVFSGLYALLGEGWFYIAFTPAVMLFVKAWELFLCRHRA